MNTFYTTDISILIPNYKVQKMLCQYSVDCWYLIYAAPLTFNIENKQTVVADIEGGEVNGVTLPPNIMDTTSRPDLVIVNTNTSPTSEALVELTIPFTRNIEAGKL